ncbi:aldose 1-epimerase family protein [Nocardioides sp. JQ2195]|uniref:aldose 1-epimerase family protein n=1 Tax=Nocardioides sp. JQ2195 TaxID=2592334 RepID=UPI00143EDA7C|nr:aldose 1-epimerase family protein [Nocardioides sp. JQ2195]QIX27558.1 aldose 1-epimerase family protein [Nocardioides sp. JQ2195]
MVAPSGEQFEIRAAGHRAVVTESGAALRHLSHDGQSLIDGFAEDEMASGGRGQLLMPWPNRIEDGQYSFGGRDHQLALTEPARHNASHGLARWAAWTVEEHTANSVSLVLRVMAQKGYPWTVDLHVLYDLSADGLTVTQTATNMSDSPAPYASGAHPYLTVGDGPVDDWELTLPASRRSLVTPERLLPIGSADVAGTDFDFRVARPIARTSLNDAFTDLERDEDGHAEVVVQGRERGVVMWVDQNVRWLQVYSADDAGPTARRSLAVEPMTAQANAFRSGEDLIILAPHGGEHSVSWGIRVR